MLPFATPLLANADFYSARFIGTGSFTSSTSAALSTMGAQVGDLAVVLMVFSGSITSGSGAAWAYLNVYDAGARVAYRVLTAPDVSAGVSAPYGGKLIFYRGGATLALATNGSGFNAAHSATAAGFTRSAGHAGLFGVTRSIDASYEGVGLSAPATFLNRSVTTNFDYGGHQNAIAAFDRLTPPNARYEGQGFTFTWSQNSGSFYAYIFEIRTA